MKTQLQSDQLIKYNFDKVISINSLEIKVKEKILNSVMVGMDDRLLYQQIKSFIESETKKIKLEDIEKYKQAIDYWTKFWIDKYKNQISSLLLLIVTQIASTGKKTSSMTKRTKSAKIVPVGKKIVEFLESKQLNTKQFPIASSKVANYYSDFKNKTNEFIQNNFKEMPSLSNGKLIHGRSLFAKCERDVRFEFHQEQLEKLKDQKVELVWITSHANCSVRCEKFQGKLFSLNKTSGTTPEGIKYEPIENAINVYITTKAGKVWRNGLFGFNCRHRMKPYIAGSKPPAKVPQNVIEKERYIDSIQRQMERQIFNLKKEAYLLNISGINLKRAKILQKQASRMFKDYVEFSKANKRVWYPERCNISLY